MEVAAMRSDIARLEMTLERIVRTLDDLAPVVASAVTDAMMTKNAFFQPVVFSRGQLTTIIQDTIQKAASESIVNVATAGQATLPPSLGTETASIPVIEEMTFMGFEKLLHSPPVVIQPETSPTVSYPSPDPVAEPATTKKATALPNPSTNRLNVTVAPPRPRVITPPAKSVVSARQQLPATRPAAINKQSVQPVGDIGCPRLYLWGNAWHQVPEDFAFPRQSLGAMWRQWCCGDEELGLQPLRHLESNDMATVNNRKRLSDLRYLMRFIEQRLQDQNVWKETPTTAEADQMLRAVFPTLPFVGQGRKRELDDLKWHSAVTLLRGAVNANKKAKNEHAV